MVKNPNDRSMGGSWSVPALPRLGMPVAIVADPAALTAVNKFEVYVLVTMKLPMVMSQRRDIWENVLGAYGLTPDTAQRIHDELREALGDEGSFLSNLSSLLSMGCSGDGTLTFPSELWPECDFRVTAGEGVAVTSARYYRTRPPVAETPNLPMWSVDIDEFSSRFGPVTFGRRWPLFDDYLPAYEEHGFERNGVRYGAAFSWGLFMHASRLWE